MRELIGYCLIALGLGTVGRGVCDYYQVLQQFIVWKSTSTPESLVASGVILIAVAAFLLPTEKKS